MTSKEQFKIQMMAFFVEASSRVRTRLGRRVLEAVRDNVESHADEVYAASRGVAIDGLGAFLDLLKLVFADNAFIVGLIALIQTLIAPQAALPLGAEGFGAERAAPPVPSAEDVAEMLRRLEEALTQERKDAVAKTAVEIAAKQAQLDHQASQTKRVEQLTAFVAAVHTRFDEDSGDA